MSHRYKLVYKIVSKGPDGIDAGDVHEGYGACDAIFMASIIYPPDGSLSHLYVGLDGRLPPRNEETGEPADLDDVEWFKVWALLSARLARSATLSPEKKAFAALVFDTFCKSIEAADAVEKSKRGQS